MEEYGKRLPFVRYREDPNRRERYGAAEGIAAEMALALSLGPRTWVGGEDRGGRRSAHVDAIYAFKHGI